MPRGHYGLFPMFPRLASAISVLTLVAAKLLPICAADSLDLLRNLDINSAPHRYYDRQPQDRFAKLRAALETGHASLDRSSEKSFLESLLDALEIPPTSQTLVFSTTSLQLSLITPANPRAIYFNEDTYLGFIPGGKIEIISIDPELGGMFYILEIPKPTASPDASLAIERSRRCMNCHSGSESGYVPGLVIKSVVPGRTGGSLDAFRIDRTGHDIPLLDRFGGWYLTGEHRLTNHWANAIGQPKPGDKISKIPVQPGERFSFSRYPVNTSDILPHLVHEHQAGFVNRVLQAGYVARTYLHQSNGTLSAAQKNELEKHAHEIVHYLLFTDEAPLPAGGIKGDPAFVRDFTENRRTDSTGASLKAFDLTSRMFRHRCSYMVYSPLLDSLPIKDTVFELLKDALESRNDLAAHIPAEEKKTIQSILVATHPAFLATGSRP